MLVLSRLLNEGIWIGEDIHVIVTRIKGSQVRLGIDAPDDVVIMRDELCGQAELVPLLRSISVRSGS